MKCSRCDRFWRGCRVDALVGIIAAALALGCGGVKQTGTGYETHNGDDQAEAQCDRFCEARDMDALFMQVFEDPPRWQCLCRGDGS